MNIFKTLRLKNSNPFFWIICIYIVFVIYYFAFKREGFSQPTSNEFVVKQNIGYTTIFM